MTPERWARIKEVFGAALEMPEADRRAYLESACGGDADLRGEVERRLAEARTRASAAPRQTCWQKRRNWPRARC